MIFTTNPKFIWLTDTQTENRTKRCFYKKDHPFLQCPTLSYQNVNWKHWQQQIIHICDQNPDNTEIYWVWDPYTKSGKSFLCEYLLLNYGWVPNTGNITESKGIFGQMINYTGTPKVVFYDGPNPNKPGKLYAHIHELSNRII
ncbi:unnamed protein product [Phytomonas sp. Hart1]|nr:unnamed protein product [Phytomonas sp. Hart1]|eukprot:CCW72073.1 unnamed protein product [Phytomonas sp. isolate Hart1]